MSKDRLKINGVYVSIERRKGENPGGPDSAYLKFNNVAGPTVSGVSVVVLGGKEAEGLIKWTRFRKVDLSGPNLSRHGGISSLCQRDFCEVPLDGSYSSGQHYAIAQVRLLFNDGKEITKVPMPKGCADQRTILPMKRLGVVAKRAVGAVRNAFRFGRTTALTP